MTIFEKNNFRWHITEDCSKKSPLEEQQLQTNKQIEATQLKNFRKDSSKKIFDLKITKKRFYQISFTVTEIELSQLFNKSEVAAT